MDQLFLLTPGFENPIYPGKKFFCWHCAILEGILATNPELSLKLRIERLSWQKPRSKLVALVGEAYQSLPLLVLKEGKKSPHCTDFSAGRFFTSNKDSILRYLSEEYGIPEPHD